ncbi:MAG: hypothetical protein GY941_15420 [Planctomycetes bacterium]|nr:hypothetical protein [Planctomycetota bacterium]
MDDSVSLMDNIRLIIIVALFIVTGILIIYFRFKKASGSVGKNERVKAKEREMKNPATIEIPPNNSKAEEKETVVGEETYKVGDSDLVLDQESGSTFDLQDTIPISKEDLECAIDKKIQNVYLKIDERERVIVDKMTSIVETKFQEILNKVNSMGDGMSKKQGNVHTFETEKLPEVKKHKPMIENQPTKKRDDAKDGLSLKLDKGGEDTDKSEVMESNDEVEIHKFLDEMEGPNSEKEVKPDTDAWKEGAVTHSESDNLTGDSQKKGIKNVVSVELGERGKEIDKIDIPKENEGFDIHQFLGELEEPDTEKDVKPDIDSKKKDR